MFTQKPTEPITGTPPPPISSNESPRDEQEALERYDTPPLRNKGGFVRIFSFKGRITRTEFAVSHLAFLLYATIVIYGLKVYAEISGLFIGQELSVHTFHHMRTAAIIALCWLFIAQGVKRCHDVGWRGWFIYIPFMSFYLLFKPGEAETNRFGTPAELKEEADDEVRVRNLRQRGAICALAWLVFSPVYLLLSVRWRIQKLVSRSLLFILSPFVVCFCYTLQAAIDKQHQENRIESHALQFLNKDILGLDLKPTDIVWQSATKYRGEYTFVLTFSGMPEPAILERIETLAKDYGSGWSVYVDESATDPDDYGYYYEDYGKALSNDSTMKSKQPEYYQFSKTIRLKGENHDTKVDLTLKRHDFDAMLTLTPQNK